MEQIAQSKRGFALVSAMMGILIITAMGILVFTVSTQDVRTSSKTVGEKKAFAGAEAGIHRLNQIFDLDNLSLAAVSDVPVDPANDPDTRYTIGTPAPPASGPSTVPLFGYAIGGGQQWKQARYVARVTGTNTRYATNVPIETSVGYGPIEVTTTYR